MSISSDLVAILFVHNKSGMLLLDQDLSSGIESIEPTMLSGFMHAIRAFSEEILEHKTSAITIALDEFSLITMKGYSIMGVLAVKRYKPIYSLKLESLIEEFEVTYDEILRTSPGTINKADYAAYQTTIIQKLSSTELEAKWVPRVNCLDNEWETIVREFPVLGQVDGNITVENLLKENKTNESEMIRGLTKTYEDGLIEFTNLIAFNDILIRCSRYGRLLTQESIVHDDLLLMNPGLKAKFPRILHLIDGKHTVKDIIRRIGAQIDVEILLEKMYLQNYIKIASTELRMFILWREYVRCLTDMLQERIPTASQEINNILQTKEFRYLLAQIELTDDSTIQVDQQISHFEDISNIQLSQMAKDWHKFAKEIIIQVIDNKFFMKRAADGIWSESFFRKFSGRDLIWRDEITDLFK
ncbi:MAG: hypothetical protein ACTSYA_13465 [Candidatus Kariarchaeaceae archaeon]